MIGFGLRLVLPGVFCVVLGIVWFVSGEEAAWGIRGGSWKGPLLAVAGLAAVIMGSRMIIEHVRESASDEEEP